MINKTKTNNLGETRYFLQYIRSSIFYINSPEKKNIYIYGKFKIQWFI